MKSYIGLYFTFFKENMQFLNVQHARKISRQQQKWNKNSTENFSYLKTKSAKYRRWVSDEPLFHASCSQPETASQSTAPWLFPSQPSCRLCTSSPFHRSVRPFLSPSSSYFTWTRMSRAISDKAASYISRSIGSVRTRSTATWANTLVMWARLITLMNDMMEYCIHHSIILTSRSIDQSKHIIHNSTTFWRQIRRSLSTPNFHV